MPIRAIAYSRRCNPTVAWRAWTARSVCSHIAPTASPPPTRWSPPSTSAAQASRSTSLID